MHVFHKLSEVTQEPSDVAIGNFDGCHLGHAALIQSLKKTGGQSRLMVFTFYPHPAEVLKPNVKLERLTTTSEKLVFLEEMGVNAVLIEPFTKELAALAPENFFQHYLLHGLKAKRVCVGTDFCFGKNRAGNTETLRQLCETHGLTLMTVPPVEMDGERISSSKIRDMIREGNVSGAKKFLGRPYFVSGVVRHGDKRGGGLGFPTANLKVSSHKSLPKNGVYVTETVWQKKRYLSVANVGIRPTFEQASDTVMIEVHVLDFNASLYDETLELRFLQRLRDEKKFSSIDELKAQISKDVESARDFARVS